MISPANNLTVIFIVKRSSPWKRTSFCFFINFLIHKITPIGSQLTIIIILQYLTCKIYYFMYNIEI